MSWLEPIAAFLSNVEGSIFIVAAVFVRISAVAFFAPALGERVISIRIRLAAATALAFVVAPLIIESAPPAPATAASLFIFLSAEVVAGLLIGFALRLFIFSLQITGAIAAQSLSLSQLLGSPVGVEAESPYTAILVMAGLALAASANLHLYLAATLAESYQVFPLGHFPAGDSIAEWVTAQTADILRVALALGAPFVILGFIYSLALAAASRAMPQLMAAFVGAPAITLAGLALFAATAPILLVHWLRLFGDHLGRFYGLAP